MDFEILVEILMMLIAATSAFVAFSVYRSSTDPHVIVYPELDRKRPSIINLMIKNIGSAPAQNITFDSDRPLPKRAFSIQIPDELPDQMDDGPLIVGVPFLAPGQELVLTWGQYGGLRKLIGFKPISVESRYERTQKLFFQKKELGSTSLLDIESFAQVDNSDHNWDKKIAKELEKISKELPKLVNATQKNDES